MLAELNGPVPKISLKIDLVVSVIIKDLPQAVYRPYRFDSLVGNTGEGFAEVLFRRVLGIKASIRCSRCL